MAEVAPCERFALQKRLDVAPTTAQGSSGFGELWEGKLFFKDGAGDCLPTNDTYLVGVLENGSPRILASFEGHSLSVKPFKLGGKSALLAFYHTGANLVVLSPYLVESQSLLKVSGEPLSSNMGKITAKGDYVTVNYQETDSAGKLHVVERRYQYKNGAYTRVESPVRK